MTTSQETSFLSEILEGDKIPAGKLAYFRQRLRNAFYDLVISEFMRQEDESGLTQAELARRIGKRPEVVNRLLGSPGNWTTDTSSDLLLGMGVEPKLSVSRLALMSPRNFDQPEWLGTPSELITSEEDEPTSTTPSATTYYIRAMEPLDA